MNAFAPFQRHSAPLRQSADAGASGGQREYQAQVIESCGEQPWAEFCKGLKEPAFLLAVVGLADPNHF